MSNYEYHRGKIREIITEDINRFADAKLIVEGITLPEDYETSLEFLIENMNYVATKDRLFEIVEDKELDLDNLGSLYKIKNNLYAFEVYFYNEGTCLIEMLEEAIERLDTE